MNGGWQRLVRQSAFRLAVLYSALFTGSGLALIGIVYWQTAGVLIEEVDNTIAAEINTLAERYRVGGLPGITDLIRERLSRQPAGDYIYLLVGPSGVPVVGNLSRWPAVQPGPEGWVEFDLGNAPAPVESLRQARGRMLRLDGGYRLLVGRDMLEVYAFQERMLTALGWALAVTVVLALAGAGLVGRRASRRVAELNEAIDEIVSGALHRRLPIRGAGDEMDELAAHVNGMLDRIQELMAGVRQVSDNIAHDLRTPLARLKRRLERAIEDRRAGEDAEEALRGALAEADALLSTFGALLRIARIEAEGRRERFTRVDVAGLLGDVVELYEPVGESQGVAIRERVREELELVGDRDLLFQALANLVDNALKYSPEASEVELTATKEDGHVQVQVADRGPGIPSEDRDRVFQRLVRLDDSRSSPGSGLGLSLVRAVARLHEGSVRLEDNDPGVRAVLRLPASPPPHRNQDSEIVI